MDMKKILQAIDSTAKQPVEGSSDMAKFVQIVNEGANPHKVSLPVQMVMQHYQKPKLVNGKTSLIKKYLDEVQVQQQEYKTVQQEQIKKHSKRIADRVLMRESQVNETPIELSGEPNDPFIYGHEKANPMSLKGRISQARSQLKDLASMAESDELVVWEKICKLAKGGMFMGLEQNLEQIRHGIEELSKVRKQGGVRSKGIDKSIGTE